MELAASPASMIPAAAAQSAGVTDPAHAAVLAPAQFAAALLPAVRPFITALAASPASMIPAVAAQSAGAMDLAHAAVLAPAQFAAALLSDALPFITAIMSHLAAALAPARFAAAILSPSPVCFPAIAAATMPAVALMFTSTAAEQALLNKHC